MTNLQIKLLDKLLEKDKFPSSLRSNIINNLINLEVADITLVQICTAVLEVLKH